MRRVSLVLVLAACGNGGDGAVLSFTAPDGSSGATRIELVLASADSGAMTTAKQRVRPGTLTEESVVYYRQRSSVDAIEGITTLDGFEVRIEPDKNVVDDEAFVPFALIYDAQDALIGVGTVNDADGIPSPVLVRPGTVASYDITVVQLAPDPEDGGVAVGQGHAIACEGQQGSWPSGAVWRASSGPQIRLLLPDVSADPDSTSAMERDADLDCDTHAAGAQDCDDLRVAYHPGQTESCDGADTDCDGRRLELFRGCQDSTVAACSSLGVQVCAEGPDHSMGTPSQCFAPAACACEAATPLVYCNRCELDSVQASGGAAACAPAIGKLHFQRCDPPGCAIEVVGADGAWEFALAASEFGPFTSHLTGITVDYFYLRATYLGTAPFSHAALTHGAAYVAVSSPMPGRPPRLLPINLESGDLPGSQCPQSQSAGYSSMRCSP